MNVEMCFCRNGSYNRVVLRKYYNLSCFISTCTVFWSYLVSLILWGLYACALFCILYVNVYNPRMFYILSHGCVGYEWYIGKLWAVHIAGGRLS